MTPADRKIPHELMTLEFEFPAGKGDVQVGENHPLVTVFRKSIRTGEGTGSWVFLLAKEDGHDSPTILGTLAYSPGKRILFFPGHSGEVFSDHARPVLNGRTLDHLTLELDDAMSRWSEHVAVLGVAPNRGHEVRGRVRPGFLHPWFSLLLNDLGKYRQLPRRLRLAFEVPVTDRERRLPVMMGSGQSAAPPHLSALDRPDAGYLQIDVWAGRGPGWKSLESCLLPLAGRVDFIEATPPDQTVKQYKQRLQLSDEAGVVVYYARPIGRPTRPGLWHARIDTDE